MGLPDRDRIIRRIRLQGNPVLLKKPDFTGKTALTRGGTEQNLVFGCAGRIDKKSEFMRIIFLL